MFLINSDFTNSEYKHKHKHKRKKLFKISAAWPSFMNTTWLQPCLLHFTVQTTCLSFNILASWCLLNENYAIFYEYIIKQYLVIDNTHFLVIMLPGCSENQSLIRSVCKRDSQFSLFSIDLCVDRSRCRN